MRISGKMFVALVTLSFSTLNYSSAAMKKEELIPLFIHKDPAEYFANLDYQKCKEFWVNVHEKTRVLFYQDMVFWYRRGGISSPSHEWLTEGEELLKRIPTLSFVSFPQEHAIIFPYYSGPTMRCLVKKTDVYRIVHLPDEFLKKVYSGEIPTFELEKELVNVKDDKDLYGRAGDSRHRKLLDTFALILLNYETSKGGLERGLKDYYRKNKRILTNEELQKMPLDFTNPLLEIPGMRLDFLLDPYGERLQIEGMKVIEPDLIQKVREEKSKALKANFREIKRFYPFLALPFVFFWIVVALSVHRFILIKILHIKVYTRGIFYWQLKFPPKTGQYL